MGKKRTVDDEVFGTMTHALGDLWKRPIEFRIFGKSWTVSLNVDIDPTDGIERNQIIAYKTFTENQASVVSESEIAVVKYYQSICKDVRARFGISDPKDARVPLAKSKKDVFRLAEPEGITFPYVCPKPTFGILCRCTWEEEHGLAVKFENGKLVEVGFQDIVL